MADTKAKETPATQAALGMLGSGLIVAIALGLYFFGSPAEPGQRRNAIFLAFEELFGYYETCMGLGVLAGLYFVWSSGKLVVARAAEAKAGDETDGGAPS